jgi:hypothetical protein
MGGRVVPATETNRRVVVWFAVASAALAIIYVVGQLLEWRGLLGSSGGPDGISTPLGIVVLLLPSLLLASAFVITMAALHSFAPAGKNALSRAALAFATMYATLVSLVYFVQLTLVAPRMVAGDMTGIEFLRFVPYRSFLFAVDLLGYSFMSVSTLLGAFALPEFRQNRWAKALMAANGLLLPFVAFQMLVPQLIWGGALWGFTFPAAMLSVASMVSQRRDIARPAPEASVEPTPAPG